MKIWLCHTLRKYIDVDSHAHTHAYMPTWLHARMHACARTQADDLLHAISLDWKGNSEDLRGCCQESRACVTLRGWVGWDIIPRSARE